MNIRLAVLAGLLLPCIALAQSADLARHPTIGTVYSLQEKGYAHYQCRLDQQERLHCDFQETSIAQSPGLEDTRKSNEDLIRQFEAGEIPFNEEECSGLDEMRAGQTSPDALAELLAIVDAFEAICEEQTVESVRRLTQLTEAIEARTCRVRSQTYNQSFKETSPGNWTNVAEPHGPCGVVSLDRFERSDQVTESGLTFWNYFAEKKVSTPRGMDGDVVNCSVIDETRYEFVWQRTDHVMDCRYIKFGWF